MAAASYVIYMVVVAMETDTTWFRLIESIKKAKYQDNRIVYFF